ncbi:MAG: hypothetical protein IPK83_14525 [Planctomycetes bacterium]|nr:hypothetical protein [Planctomycetota bacterium]
MQEENEINSKGDNAGNSNAEDGGQVFEITLEVPHLDTTLAPKSAPPPVPQIVLREDGADITSEQLPCSIPDIPLHLCPNCDYNLTSLRTCRCPECGELFDLIEAKRHGAKSLPHVQDDIRAVFANNISLFGGLALYFTSFLVGRWYLHGQRGGWGAWLAFIAMLILAVVLMYKVYFQRTLSEAVLLAGIVAAATVGMIAILFG